MTPDRRLLRLLADIERECAAGEAEAQRINHTALVARFASLRRGLQDVRGLMVEGR